MNRLKAEKEKNKYYLSHSQIIEKLMLLSAAGGHEVFVCIFISELVDKSNKHLGIILQFICLETMSLFKIANRAFITSVLILEYLYQ